MLVMTLGLRSKKTPTRGKRKKRDTYAYILKTSANIYGTAANIYGSEGVTTPYILDVLSTSMALQESLLLVPYMSVQYLWHTPVINTS